MYLSNSFMSNILGAIGIIMYIAAPFFENVKKALIYRLLAELFLGLMYFYIGSLAGASYCIVLLVSVILEKQIENNKFVSIIYGIIACLIVFIINNNGLPGKILALSLLLIYFPIDEKKMLTTSTFIDVVTSLILLYYSISVKSISGIIFGILLFIVASAGLFSAVRLVKGGGLSAAAAEDELYKRSINKKKIKKNKKGN